MELHFVKDQSRLGTSLSNIGPEQYGFWRANRAVDEERCHGPKAAEKNGLTRMYPELNNNVIDVYITDNTPDEPVFIRAIQDATCMG